jgi:hypothetical protein
VTWSANSAAADAGSKTPDLGKPGGQDRRRVTMEKKKSMRLSQNFSFGKVTLNLPEKAGLGPLFPKLSPKTNRVLGKAPISLFFVCAVLVSCQAQKAVPREEDRRIEGDQTGETGIDVLRRYAREISLTNPVITALEEYYLNNDIYPSSTDNAVLEMTGVVSNQAGKEFTYVWFGTHYALYYRLPEGTFLFYWSEDKSWEITDVVP